MRRVCLCAFVTTSLFAVVVFVWVTFSVALPLRRAYYLELDYQRTLIASRSSVQAGLPAPVQPLIEDVEQLFYWTDPDSEYRTYDRSLGLNLDGTATPQRDLTWYGHGKEMWIYLTGTAPDSAPQPNAYTHKWKKPDCDDPTNICDSHLDAFRRIAKRWPTTRFWGPNGITARTQLRWIDCDVSPLLCSAFWGFAGTNLLVHMKTGTDCSYSMIPSGSCSIQWRWIGLPVYHTPWTRQIRIPLDRGGSTVVPAFPSAEEQMWNVMSYPAALDYLNYDDKEDGRPGWNSMSVIKPVRDEIPVIEGGLTPTVNWGQFRAYVDNPWNNEEWPYEYEMKCYVERYADMLLGWWDDAADIVQPRNCTGIGEARRQERRENEEAWAEWQARKDKKFKKEWDEMMEKTFAQIKERDARENGVVYDDATCTNAKDEEVLEEEETDDEEWGTSGLFAGR